MRFLNYLVVSTLFTLLIPASGFARSNNRGTMNLDQPAMVGSTQLQPGSYKVEWNGTGPNVHVNIMQHNNTVASTTGELKTNDQAASQDAVVLRPAPDNSSQKEVAEIDFSKHKEALVLNHSSGMNRGQ